MKQYLVGLCLIGMMASSSYAQDNESNEDEPAVRTEQKRKRVKRQTRPYFTVELSQTSIQGRSANFFGVGGGLVFDIGAKTNFLAGVRIHRLSGANQITWSSGGANNTGRSLWYGGPEIQVMHHFHPLISAFIGSEAGWGRFGYTNPNGDQADSGFIAEPFAGVRANVAGIGQLGAGLSYRYWSGLDDSGGLNSEELSGWTRRLYFRAGI